MEETQIVANVLSTTQLFVMRRYLTSVVGPCPALEVIELVKVRTKAISDHQHKFYKRIKVQATDSFDIVNKKNPDRIILTGKL